MWAIIVFSGNFIEFPFKGVLLLLFCFSLISLFSVESRTILHPALFITPLCLTHLCAEAHLSHKHHPITDPLKICYQALYSRTKQQTQTSGVYHN